METYFYPDELEGGRNLLQCTDLKVMRDGFVVNAWSQSGTWQVNRIQDEEYPNVYKLVAKLTNNSAGNSVCYYRIPETNFQYTSKTFFAGKTYSFSYFLKTNFDFNGAVPKLEGSNLNGNPINLTSGQWQEVRFSGIYNMIPVANRFNVAIAFNNANLPIGSEVQMKLFKVEEGHSNTEWTKSPEDINIDYPENVQLFRLGERDDYITIPYSKMLNKDGRNRKLENKTENFVVSNLKIEDMVNKLATNFAKDKNSNNHKLLNLAYLQLKKLEEDLNRQLDWLDINKAKGYALDLIGKRVGIFRGLMDDDKYRVRIKSKISENLSDGTVNTVIQALALALNINVDKVHIRPLFPEGKPATIIIENIPASSLNKAGVTQEELVEVVQKIIATGVRVESINLEGTFRFSPIRNQVVVNAATGLSDIAMTTGGKLGAILSTN